jgi:hypothetical protein
MGDRINLPHDSVHELRDAYRTFGAVGRHNKPTAN